MADPQDPRVAVYLDFDNIVISWYDRVHGRNAYGKDRQRITENPNDPEVIERLRSAMIEVGAIIDYAASFGTLVLTRAYADWSSHVNAEYRSQLVARAVDLVQLFPAAAYAKNGADIRLAVDAVEDMFRLPDLTHVVIVAGDSDYVPLAQRCKRLGRYVIGVGVAGSTAKSLAAACDEFESYDSLPGVVRPAPKQAAPSAEPVAPQVTEPVARRKTANAEPAAPRTTADAEPEAPATKPKAAVKSRAKKVAKPAEPVEESAPTTEQEEATLLLERALRLGHDKAGADEWLHSSAVKTHMRRMDPSFSEKALGYRSFSDFLKSRDEITELEETGHERLVRLLED
ncbi:NYN domain-containing protein [Microbacterium sp. A84]|uniref:NYN domain-containing protein n=1 Tax=Microbacterium sp. A84 TaxID=3450715 RepID=UPI003F43C126